jgi:hypothetical protein
MTAHRTSAIETDLLTAHDAVAAHDGAPAQQVCEYIELGALDLALNTIRDWLTETGVTLDARAMQALARADMALRVERFE